MAQPADLSDSYAGVGIREDVSDLIFNISPTETPALSAAGTTTATQRLHQWQIDTLATPDGTRASIEGDTSSLEARAETTLHGNYTVIQKITYGVSGTYEVVEKYGRDSQMAYQAAKAARELKTHADAAITGVNQGSAVGSSSVARLTGSFETWLATNNELAAGGDITAPTSTGTAARTTGTATRAFTQALLDSVIGQCWDNGGKPTTILAGRKQKEVLSTFDGIGNVGADSTARTDRATRTIYATADVYVSNFGRLDVVPSRHITQRANVDEVVFVMDPEYIKVAYLRPWQQYDLAKTGDNIQREMLVEWALEVCNEKAHGIVADCS